MIPDEPVDQLSSQTQEKLASFVSKPSVKAHSFVLRGSVHQQILLLAEKLNADTFAEMARRLGAKITQLEPVAAQLVRYAKCSVSVIR